MATPDEQRLRHQDVDDVCAEPWPTMREALEQAQALQRQGRTVQLAPAASPGEHRQHRDGSWVLAEVIDPIDGVIGEIRYWTGQ